MAAHRYWRLRSQTNNGGSCTTITELIMATTAGGATVCTGGTAIKSSEQAGWEATKAFDGIVSGDQGWASAANDIEYAWIGYDFGAGNLKDIVEVRVISRSLAGAGLAQSPRIFFIQYSDDGTNWKQRGPCSGDQTGWTANQTRTFSIGSSDTISSSYVYKNASESSRSIELKQTRPSSFKKGTTGGIAKFAGTVNTSGSVVPGAWVRAFDSVNGNLAGESVSDIIGEWEITGLMHEREYFLVAVNPDTAWEQKISSRRFPSREIIMSLRNYSAERAVATLV